MNSVQLMGFITRDPIIGYTAGPNPSANARFTLSVADRWDVKKVNYISCKAFGKTAELIEKYCHNGKYIGIMGHIVTGSYEKDGRKIYTTDVFVDELTFTPKEEKTVEAKAAEPDPDAPAIPSGFEKLNDDDIPF